MRTSVDQPGNPRPKASSKEILSSRLSGCGPDPGQSPVWKASRSFQVHSKTSERRPLRPSCYSTAALLLSVVFLRHGATLCFIFSEPLLTACIPFPSVRNVVLKAALQIRPAATIKKRSLTVGAVVLCLPCVLVLLCFARDTGVMTERDGNAAGAGDFIKVHEHSLRVMANCTSATRTVSVPMISSVEIDHTILPSRCRDSQLENRRRTGSL